MTSFTILWERALKELKAYYAQNNNLLAFDSYLKILKPEFEEDDTLYFTTEQEGQRELINQRFLGKIADSVKHAAFEITGMNKSYVIKILLPAELDKYVMESTTVAPRQKNSITLNPNYTFDNFVVGNANKYANAAARAVADAPGQTYNPLFIYGGVGLGKTHLMHAIGNQIAKNNPYAQIIYITSESFRNEFIEAIRNESNEAFRNKYRNADALLIDDIQFIAKGPGTQEELFHTFNRLYEYQKLIVISSDKHPSEIPNLESRLMSRFQWGLLTDIGMPDYETRVAIIKTKIPMIMEQVMCDMSIDEDVIQYIASKEDTNIREIEGALKMLIAHAKLSSMDSPVYSINMEIAQDALRNFFTDSSLKEITPKIIIKNVCEYFDITQEDILSGKKSREVAFPRQIAMYLLRNTLNLAYPKIGEIMGGRHYSTAMFAYDKITEQLKTDNDLKNKVNNIIHRIKE